MLKAVRSRSVSPRRDYILFSTKSPPSVQRIPWPTVHHEDDDDIVRSGRKRDSNLYDTWLLTEDTFPWLLDSNVVVNQISYSRTTGVETWITSDGRAYLVQLYEPPDVESDTASEHVSQ